MTSLNSFYLFISNKNLFDMKLLFHKCSCFTYRQVFYIGYESLDPCVLDTILKQPLLCVQWARKHIIRNRVLCFQRLLCNLSYPYNNGKRNKSNSWIEWLLGKKFARHLTLWLHDLFQEVLAVHINELRQVYSPSLTINLFNDFRFDKFMCWESNPFQSLIPAFTLLSSPHKRITHKFV